MAIRSVSDLDVNGKKVFCRVDFNVPMDKKEKCVRDDTRIRAALPTIRHLLDNGARPILASHLGRPKGVPSDEFRLEPVGQRLAELLGEKYRVVVTDEPCGDGARKVVSEMKAGDVVLLENVRFDTGETKNDEKFSKALAELADLYVNDAFGTAHRAHASTVGVIGHLTHPAPNRAAGFLMMREIEMLGRLTGDVERPYVAVLGGAKVSDKIGVIESLLSRVDALIIGGAMANTFLVAQGKGVGTSLVEENKVSVAKHVLDAAQRQNAQVLLPVDVVVASNLTDAKGSTVSIDQIPTNQMVLDIGPATQAAYADRLASAKTVFWNGPMGVFEQAAFAEGTFAVARAVASSSAFSVVGGGDSVAAIHKSGLADKISHISTGGGASLEYVEGRTLPGLAALEES